ncbi:MAG: FtsQ-type POTRA domain-containing protein [Defluviitaleaceae bacterium]|nr:FtsQ-type POTRA domain-containing protein [Defluviitaleaceae bacterium]
MRRFNNKFLAAAIVGIIALAVLLFLISPFFRIQTIVISGNIRFTQEEILGGIGTEESAHLLLFNTRRARQNLKQNMYIGEVQFERLLPGRLHVSITERRLTAYVEHIPGSFLYLDDNGRVLEVRNYKAEPLPVLQGLQITGFQVGQLLEVPDVAAFNVVVQYAQLLNQHGLIDRVSHINVSDAANIRIIIGYKDFNVGGVANADEKVRTIAQILYRTPDVELIRGFMDLTVVRSQYVFEKLQ